MVQGTEWELGAVATQLEPQTLKRTDLLDGENDLQLPWLLVQHG